MQEQKREHATQAEMDRAEEQAYAEQTAAITRMRGMLEDEATAKKAAMMRAVQEENLRLAQAKRDREAAWRADQQAQNKAELDATNNSDIMTENFATTQSKLANSRYVPYHFKALRPEQKAEIEATRAQQVRENKEARKFEKEEEAAWAAQQAANNQMLLQNEIDKAEQYRAMNAQMRDESRKEKVEKDARWPNMYRDQDPLPVVDRDLDLNSAYVAGK